MNARIGLIQTVALTAVATFSLGAFAGSDGADMVDIPFTRYVLDNGLRVVVHEDRKAPLGRAEAIRGDDHGKNVPRAQLRQGSCRQAPTGESGKSLDKHQHHRPCIQPKHRRALEPNTRHSHALPAQHPQQQDAGHQHGDQRRRHVIGAESGID